MSKVLRVNTTLTSLDLGGKEKGKENGSSKEVKGSLL